MRNAVGLALALAILALAAALVLPAFESYEEGVVGEYQLVPAGVGRMYRLDTITGDAWISQDGGDWEPIGEADDSALDEWRAASARGQAPSARPASERMTGARRARGAGLR